ncbi:hypothetical protein BH18CHL1_BH18CHL1_03870 [soil metagenome]
MLAGVMLGMVAACSGGTGGGPGDPSPMSHPGTTPVATESIVPTPSGTVLQSDPPWLGRVRDSLELDLEPLPSGAPSAPISQQEAIDIALAALGREDIETVTEHGIGYISEQESESVWLVAYQITDGEPYPVGPICPETGRKCTYAVGHMAGALVSDQTGRILRTFKASGYAAPPPVPSGSEPPD